MVNSPQTPNPYALLRLPFAANEQDALAGQGAREWMEGYRETLKRVLPLLEKPSLRGQGPEIARISQMLRINAIGIDTFLPEKTCEHHAGAVIDFLRQLLQQEQSDAAAGSPGRNASLEAGKFTEGQLVYYPDIQKCGMVRVDAQGIRAIQTIPHTKNQSVPFVRWERVFAVSPELEVQIDALNKRAVIVPEELQAIGGAKIPAGEYVLEGNLRTEGRVELRKHPHTRYSIHPVTVNALRPVLKGRAS